MKYKGVPILPYNNLSANRPLKHCMSRCFKSKHTKDEFNSTKKKCLACNVGKETLERGMKMVTRTSKRTTLVRKENALGS